VQPSDVFHCETYIRVVDAETVKAVNASLEDLPQANGIFLSPYFPY